MQNSTFLADFSVVTSIEELQIALKSALVQNLLVPLLVPRRAKDDVVLRLRSANGKVYARHALTLMVSLKTQDSCAAYATPFSLGKLYQESGTDGMKCISPVKRELTDHKPTYLLTEKRHEQTRLSRTSRTDNQVDNTLLEQDLALDLQ